MVTDCQIVHYGNSISWHFFLYFLVLVLVLGMLDIQQLHVNCVVALCWEFVNITALQDNKCLCHEIVGLKIYKKLLNRNHLQSFNKHITFGFHICLLVGFVPMFVFIILHLLKCLWTFEKGGISLVFALNIM